MIYNYSRLSFILAVELHGFFAAVWLCRVFYVLSQQHLCLFLFSLFLGRICSYACSWFFVGSACLFTILGIFWGYAHQSSTSPYTSLVVHIYQVTCWFFHMYLYFVRFTFHDATGWQAYLHCDVTGWQASAGRPLLVGALLTHAS